jgi:hypothetical protein
MLPTPQANAKTSGGVANGCRSVALTEVSWVARRQLSASDWVRQGRTLGSLGRAVGWWLGDWLRYGSAHYGERYAMAARITGYDKQTLMNMTYVASRFEVSRRRESLSFSHHAELAPLTQAAQESWLQRAEEEHLSVHALRSAVRRDDRSGPPSPYRRASEPAALPRNGGSAGRELNGPGELGNRVVCPECGHRFPEHPGQA